MGSEEFYVDRDIWPEELPRKLEFYHGRRPLHEYMQIQSDERPDRPAVTFYGETLTWKELDNQVDLFAKGLRSLGYNSGDVIALYLQNSPQFLIAYYGAHRAGNIVTPINPQIKAPALEHQLNDSGAKGIVTHTNLIDNVEKVVEDTELENIFVTLYKNYAGTSSPIPLHPVVKDEPSLSGKYTSFSEFIETSNMDKPLPEVSNDELALFQYTAGTTGMPKGCKHTHWNVLFNATATARQVQMQPEEVLLAIMPLFHVGGKSAFVDSLTTSGVHVVYLPRFTPLQVMEAIEEFEVSMTWLTVPAAAAILFHEKLDNYDLSSLSENRSVTPVSSFGINLTPEISEAWREVTGARLQEISYGITETHACDTNTVGVKKIEPGFVGQPNWGTEIEIRDFETNETLGPGEQGEIVVQSPSIMGGYLNRPNRTEEVFDSDGFFHTGDIGKMSEEGYLYFQGRQKDSIKVSGHITSPEEVENILREVEGVEDVIVVGKPHETRGSVLEAHVVAKHESVSKDEIISKAQENLAEYKVPKSVKFVDSLPKTDIGKVDRVAYYERLPDDYE